MRKVAPSRRFDSHTFHRRESTLKAHFRDWQWARRGAATHAEAFFARVRTYVTCNLVACRALSKHVIPWRTYRAIHLSVSHKIIPKLWGTMGATIDCDSRKTPSEPLSGLPCSGSEQSSRVSCRVVTCSRRDRQRRSR